MREGEWEENAYHKAWMIRSRVHMATQMLHVHFKTPRPVALYILYCAFPKDEPVVDYYDNACI